MQIKKCLLVEASKGDVFMENLQKTINDLQASGLEAEVKYQVVVLPNERILPPRNYVYSALVLGKEQAIGNDK